MMCAQNTKSVDSNTGWKVVDPTMLNVVIIRDVKLI